MRRFSFPLPETRLRHCLSIPRRLRPPTPTPTRSKSDSPTQTQPSVPTPELTSVQKAPPPARSYYTISPGTEPLTLPLPSPVVPVHQQFPSLQASTATCHSLTPSSSQYPPSRPS